LAQVKADGGALMRQMIETNDRFLGADVKQSAPSPRCVSKLCSPRT